MPESWFRSIHGIFLFLFLEYHLAREIKELGDILEN